MHCLEAHIAVVSNQPLFAKAIEIAWKNPAKFESIVLMMGKFQRTCNLLSTTSKMFDDVGLHDLAKLGAGLAVRVPGLGSSGPHEFEPRWPLN